MGRPIKTDFVPSKMQWGDQRGRAIPDFDNGLILNVSSRAKALIEKLEPAVHQFLPVDYFDRTGKFIEARYFLIVCNRLDGVDREHSRMRLVKDMMWSPDGVDNPKLVFNRRQIGNAHLWCDKRLPGGAFVSDEFAGVLKGSGMTGLRFSDAPAETV
jgi:hypothetical protein